MKWPENKEFAFTIIDDTDNATLKNIKPIYDLLDSLSIKTTKTVWVYPPRDHFEGESLENEDYLQYMIALKHKGFDIQLHNVGSGIFSRFEIIQGIETFKDKMGYYPTMQINHGNNPDCIYWGYKRFGYILRNIYRLIIGKHRQFHGEEELSAHFWGDICKKHIRFIRNRVFKDVNTLKCDPQMPFLDKDKEFCNFWFSSSDGHSVQFFNQLIAKENIEKLKREKGVCIVYTHFASGFLNNDGSLNQEFKDNLLFLSSQNGWFVPANEILEHLLANKPVHKVNKLYIHLLDFKWLKDNLYKSKKLKAILQNKQNLMLLAFNHFDINVISDYI